MKSQEGSQAKAWAFSIVLHLLLVLILGFLSLGVPQNDPIENNAGGMALALGVPDGITNPSVSSSSEQSAESAITDPKSKPVATQDLEEAPVVKPKTNPPAETRAMDPRLKDLLAKPNKRSPQNSSNKPPQGAETGLAQATGQSSGNGGFSASGDGLESRGFAQDPDPDEFKILDAKVDIPIEVDREGRVRVIGMPKGFELVNDSIKLIPLTVEQRRALVEATQKARFKRSENGKEIQKGVLHYELKVRRKS